MADYLSLIPASIRDARTPGWAALLERLGEEDLTPLLIYRIDSVHASALPHLADQFNLLKSAYWKMARTEAEQRAILKQAITLHKKKGTPWAIKAAAQAIGFMDVELIRRAAHWTEYKVAVDGKYLSPDDFDLLPQAIEEFANARSKLIRLGLGRFTRWGEGRRWGDGSLWGGHLLIERRNDVYDTAADWEQGTFERCAPTPGGGVGLETYRADMATDDSAKWEGQADGALGNWTWNTAEKRLEATGGNNNYYYILKDFVAADVDVELSLSQSQYGCVVLRYKDVFNHYLVQVVDDTAPGGPNNVVIYKRIANAVTQLAAVNVTATRGEVNTFRIKLEGYTFQVQHNGATVLTYTDPGASIPDAGSVGMRYYGNIALHLRSFAVNPIAPALSRPSVAYHPLTGVQFAGGAPRFVELAGTVGLMVEEAGSPLTLWSDALDNAYWNKAQASILANAITAPDGTMTADKLVENTATAPHYFARGAVFTLSAAGVVVLYAKAGERNWIFIDAGGGTRRAYFDLATGQVGTVGSGATATMLPVGDGWYLCAVAASAVEAENCQAGLAESNGFINYAGDGASGAYFWRVNGFPKSYYLSPIKTEGTTITRAAEVPTIPTKNLISVTKGKVRARFRLNVMNAVQVIWNPSGHEAKRFMLYAEGSKLRLQINESSTLRTLPGTTTLAVDTWYEAEAEWDQDAGMVYLRLNGNLEASLAMVPDFTILPLGFIGTQGGTIRWLNGYLDWMEFEKDGTITRLPLDGDFSAETHAYWTGPYRHNRIIVPEKTITVEGVVPAGASITTEHRTKAKPSDADGAWTAQADTPSNDLLQTRARLAGRTGKGLELQRLTITPM